MSRSRFIPQLAAARIHVNAQSVRNVAGEGISAGGRSVRTVAHALIEPSWNEDQVRILLPAEMRQERIDLVLFTVALGLFVLGLVMVFSAGAFISNFNTAGPYGRLVNQGVRGLFGLVVLLVIAHIDYRRWDAWSPWIAAVTAFFLLLVLVPGVGHVKKGAMRWIGFGPVVLQPTEFARIGVIVYMARLLSKRPEKMEDFRSGPLPALLVSGAFMLLILKQPSLGSALAMGTTALVMCVVAGMRWKHFWMMVGGALASGCLFVLLAQGIHRYQSNRLFDWINFIRGIDDPQGATYQLHQSLMAIGTGAWLGKGIGAGLSKWFFLPDAHTDFIYSLIGEEMGFIGSFLVLVAFAVLIGRGLRIALEAEDRYGYLLAAGITINFAVYATINVAVTTGSMPTTGLPLPLVSYGGSALIANMVAVGLLLSISRRRGSGITLGGRMRKRSS
jgi:cell division protein FtsW